jgi:hypothetical protein
MGGAHSIHGEMRNIYKIVFEKYERMTPLQKFSTGDG